LAALQVGLAALQVGLEEPGHRVCSAVAVLLVILRLRQVVRVSEMLSPR
jgi:hypothetical protein